MPAPAFPMTLLNWLSARLPAGGPGALARARQAFRETAQPLISPRRSRRLLRREQLFTVVRESLIRGGVLSTSYAYKVLSLDKDGDGFLVLIDLALPAQTMPDEFLLEIERWIQQSARSRHAMSVRSVYWRRNTTPEQVGQALRAAMGAQTRAAAAAPSDTALPRPPAAPRAAAVQAVSDEEVRAFRAAIRSMPEASVRHPREPRLSMPTPEAVSDFAALSDTQNGKL